MNPFEKHAGRVSPIKIKGGIFNMERFLGIGGDEFFQDKNAPAPLSNDPQKSYTHSPTGLRVEQNEQVKQGDGNIRLSDGDNSDSNSNSNSDSNSDSSSSSDNSSLDTNKVEGLKRLLDKRRSASVASPTIKTSNLNTSPIRHTQTRPKTRVSPTPPPNRPTAIQTSSNKRSRLSKESGKGYNIDKEVYGRKDNFNVNDPFYQKAFRANLVLEDIDQDYKPASKQARNTAAVKKRKTGVKSPRKSSFRGGRGGGKTGGSATFKNEINEIVSSDKAPKQSNVIFRPDSDRRRRRTNLVTRRDSNISNKSNKITNSGLVGRRDSDPSEKVLKTNAIARHGSVASDKAHISNMSESLSRRDSVASDKQLRSSISPLYSDVSEKTRRSSISRPDSDVSENPLRSSAKPKSKAFKSHRQISLSDSDSDVPDISRSNKAKLKSDESDKPRKSSDAFGRRSEKPRINRIPPSDSEASYYSRQSSIARRESDVSDKQRKSGFEKGDYSKSKKPRISKFPNSDSDASDKAKKSSNHIDTS
ncbi:hypothetical protein E3P94_01203 [Wallemia ichthyophaga]|nr:hypothetical protein E3P98_00977 [Wallemia ichthyophaga]TIB02031.1 hypothetical protein E3P95_01071 [Wallemia ichthyophaga]TIB02955.1 hypothetical protein E3P94_01203 [Wallemia ichthyophaga]